MVMGMVACADLNENECAQCGESSNGCDVIESASGCGGHHEGGSCSSTSRRWVAASAGAAIAAAGTAADEGRG